MRKYRDVLTTVVFFRQLSNMNTTFLYVRRCEQKDLLDSYYTREPYNHTGICIGSHRSKFSFHMNQCTPRNWDS